MKNKIVLKFGGSNLKKKEDILQIIKVIKSYHEEVVIVVSAFYGITNFLLNALEDIPKSEDEIKKTVNYLKNQAQEVLLVNNFSTKQSDIILATITIRLNSLEKYLKGISYLGEIPNSIKDLILSFGEKITSYLLTELLKYHNLPAEEQLPEDFGLITDGEFNNATIDFEKSKKNIQKALSGKSYYVIPGFYGISENGQITLLGRGGSDYSAAAIANCLNAKSLDIWKDVDGFQSGDPKVVENPIIINNLSYTEVAELSYFGAKILHPRTVEPLIEKNIPIRLFNINNISNPLIPISIIHLKKEIHQNIIKSVTSSDNIGYLKLQGSGVGNKAGILAKITTGLADKGINIKSVITSQTVITLLFSLDDLTKAYQVTKELNLHTICDISQERNLSIIACVGEGIRKTPGIASRIFQVISNKNINIQAISFGSSEVAAYFLINHKDKEIAIKEIHQEFFVKEHELSQKM